jgi:hypothetical protein
MKRGNACKTSKKTKMPKSFGKQISSARLGGVLGKAGGVFLLSPFQLLLLSMHVGLRGK